MLASLSLGARRPGSRPPGPSGLPLVGSLFDYMGDQLGFVEETFRRHGDVASFRLGSWTVFLVSHPADIERVLVRDHGSFVKSRGTARLKSVLGEGLLTSEGEAHLRRRRQVQPAFHRKRLERHAGVMVRRAEELQEGWRPGERVDLAGEMRALALGIAGECFFGADLEAEVDEIAEALDVMVELYPRLVMPFSEVLEHLPLPATLRFRRARRRLDDVVYRLIDGAADRRREPAAPARGGRDAGGAVPPPGAAERLAAPTPRRTPSRPCSGGRARRRSPARRSGTR